MSSVCVKATDETLVLDELIPSALVFGAYSKPQIDVNQECRANFSERAAVTNKVIEVVARNMAKLHFRRVSRHRVSPAANKGF